MGASHGHDDEPFLPGLPEIRDEAADTPKWLPWLGMGLLAVAVLTIVFRMAHENLNPEATEESPAVEAPAEPE